MTTSRTFSFGGATAFPLACAPTVSLTSIFSIACATGVVRPLVEAATESTETAEEGRDAVDADDPALRTRDWLR